jgi:Bacterial regulatory proteins, luxR family
VLSEKTVRNHVSAILVKLQVPDRASAVAKARDAGIGTNQPLQTERGAVPLGTMSRIPSLGLSRCQVKEIVS